MENKHVLFDQVAEKALLSCVLLDPTLAPMVIETLKPEDFLDQRCRFAFEAVTSLSADGRTIDPLTLKYKLQENGHGKDVELPWISDVEGVAAFTARDVEEHIKRVKKLSTKRRIQRVLKSTQREIAGDENSPNDVFSHLDKNLADIRLDAMTNKTFYTATEAADELAEELNRRDERGNRIIGLSTSIEQLIKTGGLRPGVTALGGWPGRGKTIFAEQVAWKAANAGVPVAFISLEMSASELVERQAIRVSGITAYRVTGGALSLEERARLDNALFSLHNTPIYFDTDGAPTTENIITKIKTHRAKHNVGLVVIDHFQRISFKRVNNRDSEESAMSEASHRLAALSKELKIPFLVLSQFTKPPGIYGDKEPEPGMYLFKGTGSLAQDAIMIMLLHRPNPYTLEPTDPCILTVAKNRHGQGFVKADALFVHDHIKIVDTATFNQMETTSDEDALAVAEKMVGSND